MVERRTPSHNVAGEVRFVSRPFSNTWWLMQGDRELAELRRIPREHVSLVETTDGPSYRLEPQGWGAVVAMEDEAERGRITRRSWWGRAWDLTSTTFGYALTSDVIPRRWTLRVGNEPIGRLAGGYFSYNRLIVSTDVAVPTLPLMLSWHVLARPWEAAAAPGSLVAQHRPERPTLGVDG
jgi:hypothetical protein